MLRIALPSFMILALAAWPAASQSYGDEGLLGGPPASAYARSGGATDYQMRSDPRGGLGAGRRAGVVIDRAPLPFDPHLLPPNTAPGNCVERGSRGWTPCAGGGHHYDGASRYGGYVLSDTTTESGGSSYYDTGWRPIPGYGPGYGYGYGYGYSSDYPSGVGYAYGYADGGYAPGSEHPYGYGPPRGYQLAGRDWQGYLVWPGKVPRR